MTWTSGLAQDQSEYCAYLQQRIARLQGDATALRGLVAQQNVFMNLTPDPGQSVQEAINAAHSNYFTLGAWHDAETGAVYLVVTRQFMIDFARNSGLGEAAIQKALSINENLRQKVEYGGVVDSLMVEIENWQRSYREECGGGTVNTGNDNSWDGCLLGVCPD